MDELADTPIIERDSVSSQLHIFWTHVAIEHSWASRAGRWERDHSNQSNSIHDIRHLLYTFNAVFQKETLSKLMRTRAIWDL
jgi:hypothetical protein